MKLKPLAALNYIRENEKLILPVILCCALSVYFIYVFSMYVQSVFNMDNMLTEAYKSYSYIYPLKSQDSIDDELAESIKDNFSTDEVIRCGVEFTNLKMPMGGDSYQKLFKVVEDDMNYMFDKMNLKLIQGSFPEKEDEIMLSNRIAKSKKLKVGDIIGHEVNSSEPLSKAYKITGLFEGSVITGFIPVVDIEKESYKVLAVFHKAGKLSESNDYLTSRVKSKGIGVITYKKLLSDNMGEAGQMRMIFNITQIIVIIVMTLAIVNLSYIHFYRRRKEFGVLHAIGYSRKQVTLRVLKEILLLQGVGYFAGILLALATGLIIMTLLFEPKGLTLSIINSQSFIQTLAVPVFMCIFNIIPVYRMLIKIDSISIIQGNE